MIVMDFKTLLDAYIAGHFVEDESAEDESSPPHAGAAVGAAIGTFGLPKEFSRSERSFGVAGFFDKLFASKADETFSEMLLRLINDSGEKPATIYKRADIDRQIFSRIKQNKDYQPSKDTAISFAFALRLDLAKTNKLLEAAGYALTNSSKRDVIISFFIEKEEFDLNYLNEMLYDYGQPVLLKR